MSPRPPAGAAAQTIINENKTEKTRKWNLKK